MSSMREHYNFVGTIVSKEIKTCAKSLKSSEDKIVKRLLLIAQSDLTTSNHDSLEKDFENAVLEFGDVCYELYPGILRLLQLAVRTPQHLLTLKDFKNDLNEINVPEKFHDDFAKAVYSKEIRPQIDRTIALSRPSYPTIQSFRWRLDVAISTTSLNRVLEQSILVKMTTSDGKTQTFEMSKQKFHKLRHAVSYVLNQMQQLEKRSILKIDT